MINFKWAYNLKLHNSSTVEDWYGINYINSRKRLDILKIKFGDQIYRINDNA